MKHLITSNICWEIIVRYKGAKLFQQTYFPEAEIATLIVRDDENTLIVTYDDDREHEYYKFSSLFVANKLQTFIRENIKRIEFI